MAALRRVADERKDAAPTLTGGMVARLRRAVQKLKLKATCVAQEWWM
jgi:hypothetical protein